MEVNQKTPAWLDKSHPNYFRWKNARELSIERGKFVQSVVNQNIITKNLTVLDLGSGEGGTSNVFSEDNFVVSIDLSLTRLNRQKEHVIPAKSIPLEECASKNMNLEFSIGHFDQREKSESNIEKDFSVKDSFEMTNKNFVNGTAIQLPFINNSFDLIIIQDVIEHLTNTADLYSEVKRILKTNGNIYLSTPNKLSVLNFVSDPHFGLPVLSLLKRESIKKYFLKHFRKEDYNRTDIAQLFSLNELINLFRNDFKISLCTNFSVKELFNGNKGIIWSNFHLRLIALCKFIKIDRAIKKIANDKIGFINKYFTPTFYFTLKRLT